MRILSNNKCKTFLTSLKLVSYNLEYWRNEGRVFLESGRRIQRATDHSKSLIVLTPGFNWAPKEVYPPTAAKNQVSEEITDRRRNK